MYLTLFLSSNGVKKFHGQRYYSGSRISVVNLSRYHLVGLAARYGSIIDQIAFVGIKKYKNYGRKIRVFGPYGSVGGSSLGFLMGKPIKSFYGGAGAGIDRIGGKGVPIM